MVSVRGMAEGTFLVLTVLDKEPAASISFRLSDTFSVFKAPFKIKEGVHPLFFRYEGDGTLEFEKFEI